MKKTLLILFLIAAASFLQATNLFSASAQTAEQQLLTAEAPPPLLAWGCSKDAGDMIRPESFPRLSDDNWSHAIEAAARAAMQLNGATVKFACGKNYPTERTVKLDGAQQIVFLACASDYEAQGKPATITYSGTDKQGLSFRSSYGITLERMKIECSNPAFTGECVSFTHSDHNPNADSAYFNIKDSTITGTAAANQSTLLAIDGSIIGNISKVHFFHAKVGIRGMSERYGTYSNGIVAEKNSFNLVDTAIMNPSSNWRISDNIFEPNKHDKLIAVDSDCENCGFASGVTYTNNYHGDAHGQDEPLAKFRKAAGLTISGNWGIIEASRSRVAFQLDQCAGVVVSGNRVNSFKYFVETVGGTTHDLNVFGNQTIPDEMVLQTTPALGVNVMQPSTHGNVFAGVASNGETYDHKSDWGVSMGRISAIGRENAFAEIGILDGATGYLNRSLGYFAPSSNNNPHIFFTWDGSQWRNRLSINEKIASSVPLTVPDDKYNPETWKNSLEVPTKKAMYEAFQAHLASISALVEKEQANKQK